MTDNTLSHDRDGRLRFAQITDETTLYLREFWSVVQPALPSILDGFYTHVGSNPHLVRLVGSKTDRLKETQKSHWQHLFSGTFDDTHMESATRIGLAHKSVGLEPRWYIAGYLYVLNRLTSLATSKYRWTPQKLAKIICAVNTAIFLDMELAITAYHDATMANSAAQTQQAIDSVGALGAGLAALADGDLRHRIPDNLRGSFAKLHDDFNSASTKLEDAVKAVLGGADDISAGAEGIASAADDLSRRTEQQAASLEETAAALEQITATVKHTAENAKEIGTIVSAAKSAADEGGRVVDTAIAAMGQIEQSSKQINDIIGVIDEIAFQTNLLALNAGVEAARAGDAGKGFAVVASEVRALAQRSAEAAKEIKALIKASGKHVGSGVKLVGESGDALRNIIEQVISINTLVDEMALAAQQQSTGIEEVNNAVAQMDQVTQQNAAMVEESTAASRSLADETGELSRLVSFFKVGDVSPPNRASKPAHVSRSVASGPAGSVAVSRGGAALAVDMQPGADEDDWQEF